MSGFAVTISFSVRLGQLGAFVDAAERLLAAVATTGEGPGEARILSDPSRPGKAMMVLFFDDAAGFDAYRGLAELRAFDSRVVDMVTNRSISTWSNVIESGC